MMGRDNNSYVSGGEEQVHRLNQNNAAVNGIWRNVCVCIGSRPPTAKAVADYRQAIEYTIEHNPAASGVITVIGDGSTPLPEARQPLIAVFQDLIPQLSCAAFVVETRGFAAAAQRSILSALLLATGRKEKIQVFSDVKTAASWVTQQLPRPSDYTPKPRLAATLTEIIERFRSRHDWTDESHIPTALP